MSGPLASPCGEVLRRPALRIARERVPRPTTKGSSPLVLYSLVQGDDNVWQDALSWPGKCRGR